MPTKQKKKKRNQPNIIIPRQGPAGTEPRRTYQARCAPATERSRFHRCHAQITIPYTEDVAIPQTITPPLSTGDPNLNELITPSAKDQEAAWWPRQPPLPTLTPSLPPLQGISRRLLRNLAGPRGLPVAVGRRINHEQNRHYMKRTEQSSSRVEIRAVFLLQRLASLPATKLRARRV